MTRRSAALTAALLIALSTVAAEPIARSSYRGDRSGIVAGAVPAAPWSRVAWETNLGDLSKASPVRLGDALYATVEPDRLVSVDLASGAVRWDHAVPALDALDAGQAARLRPEVDAAPTLETDLRERRRRLGQWIRELRGEAPTVTQAQVGALTREADALEARLEAVKPYRVPRTDDPVGYTAATPATDGEAIFVTFANGVAASFAPDGTRRWARWFGPVPFGHHGYYGPDAASPIAVNGVVVVALGQLMGLDARTGATRWTADAYPHYGTPALAEVGGRPVLALPDGRLLDATTGAALATGLGALSYTAPYAVGDRVWYVGTDAEYNSDALNQARAWRLVPDGGGVRAELLWKVDVPTRDRVYGEPVLVGDTLISVTRNRILVALDANTGTVLHLAPLVEDGGEVWASPTLAGGTVWVPDITGHMYGIDPRPPFARVASVAVSPNASAPLFLPDGAVWRGERSLLRYATP